MKAIYIEVKRLSDRISCSVNSHKSNNSLSLEIQANEEQPEIRVVTVTKNTNS